MPLQRFFRIRKQAEEVNIKRQIAFVTLILAADCLAIADTKISFTTLPAAVQAAAKSQTNGAEIVGASKEVESGHTVYEVETRPNGKSRDLSFDADGKLLQVEEQVELDSIPVAAKAAIQKRAAGGTIRKVESTTAGNTVSYEASIVTKSGKRTEIAVNADGTPHRE
jgi:uncharacterized membrane protein YkoI